MFTPFFTQLHAPPPSMAERIVYPPLPMHRADKLALARRGYRIRKGIGYGASGFVYLASRYGTPCAVKCINMKAPNVFVSYVYMEMFILKKIRHPYMVSVLDYYFLKPQFLLIFMELVDGGNLREFLKEYYLSEVQAAGLYGQFGAALEYLHRHGFAHCDLKPENILLNAEVTVAKLADFSLSVCCYDLATGDQVKYSMRCGSPNYMAPEVLYVGVRIENPTIPPEAPFCLFLADIWSLGVILYEMLHGSGYRPYKFSFQPAWFYVDAYNTVVRMATEGIRFEGPRSKVEGVTEKTATFIMHHLMWYPEDRPDMEVLMKDDWVVSRAGSIPRE